MRIKKEINVARVEAVEFLSGSNFPIVFRRKGKVQALMRKQASRSFPINLRGGVVGAVGKKCR